MALLRKLRFSGASERVGGSLSEILRGSLAALRRLRPDTSGLLEDLWRRRDGAEWFDVVLKQGGRPVLATAQYRIAVERRAVAFATKRLQSEGWAVVSREMDGIGYDLQCTRNGTERHVEVKGTAGTDATFYMTRTEFERSKRDRAFCLAVVTSVLTRPALALYPRVAIHKHFEFSALAYSVTQRDPDRNRAASTRPRQRG